MSNLSIQASVNDQTSGGSLGRAFSAVTNPDDTQRVRQKVPIATGQVSVAIDTAIQGTPAIMVIRNNGLTISTDDASSAITWGTADGVRPHLVRIGETSIIRFVSAPAAIFWESTASLLWGEFQIWADS